MKQRWLILGTALILSIAWSVWSLLADPREEIVQASIRPRAAAPGTAPRQATAQAPASATAPLQRSLASSLEPVSRPLAPAKPRNLFGAYSYEAPRPPPVAAAPEAPHAPPLPFSYTGRLLVDGRPTYLLLQAGAPISVTVGSDVGEFKLVEAAADRLVFLHSPTGQHVAMPLTSGVN